MWVIKQFMVPIDFDSKKNGGHQNQQLFGYPHSSKYILCSTEEKKPHSD